VRAILEIFDTETGEYEEIFGIEKNRNTFTMTMVNDRFLYLFPPKINLGQLKVLDCLQLTEKAMIPPYKRLY